MSDNAGEKTEHSNCDDSTNGNNNAVVDERREYQRPETRRTTQETLQLSPVSLKKERNWSVFKQHLAAAISSLAALSAGITMGWTAPALPLLTETDVNGDIPFSITADESSWISSLMPLGALLGALPAGLLADKIGRKKAILSLGLPIALGWLLILFADDSIMYIYFGRFITGLATGAATVLVPQYNEEIAEDNIRGALGIWMDFMLCNGVTLIDILGYYCTYFWFTAASGIFSILFFVSFIWFPESPVYLIMEGRNDEAKEALGWFRQGKPNYDVDNEIRYLESHLTAQSGEKESKPFFSSLKQRLGKISTKSKTVRTVFIVYGLMFFQIGTGIDAVLFYTVDIFNGVGSDLSSNVSSIIVAACQSVCILITTFFVDSVGRKPMLLVSALVTAICHAALAIYFHFQRLGEDMSSWSWLPVGALILFVIGFTIGFSQLPWLMMAELVPTKSKHWATGGAVALNWTLVFIITKDFPDMISYLGSDVTYGIFSCMCVIGFVFVVMCVPETKGKSREEIQEALNGRKKPVTNNLTDLKSALV